VLDARSVEITSLEVVDERLLSLIQYRGSDLSAKAGSHGWRIFVVPNNIRGAEARQASSHSAVTGRSRVTPQHPTPYQSG
jgi:hypothetical protein